MKNNNKNGNNSQNNNNTSRRPKFNLSWMYLLLFGLVAYMFFSKSGGTPQKQLAYTDFQACLDSGYVKEILVNKDNLTLKFAVNATGERYIYGDVATEPSQRRVPQVEFGSVEGMEQQVEAAKEAGKFSGKLTYEHDDNMLWNILLQAAPIVILVFFWFFIMNRMGGGGMAGGIFNFGKSKAKLFEQDSTKDRITFKDVAGQTEAKREVHEIVDFLKNPAKYTELGGKIPKGALLVGPPGTGKTLLAKAVAGEAEVPFFSMSGSDFVEMFVGVGASRVRDLFQQAKEKSPCIIFIDEIDAIGRARANRVNTGGNDERENTLNQLLTEMDGFGTNSGIIILAATNRADILDKALLRAGRFDRQIHVDLPDLNERKAIFNVHLRPIKIDETVDVDTLARQTPGFSGADIANVCNEAALIAARNNSPWVNKQCFLDAVDRIIGGLEKKSKVMTDAEKRAIALHEAGHATISWFCQYANPLVKVTIVPRGQALGAAWYMPEERQITTKEEILDEICATLGGRAAEELCIGRISTGAMNDLEKVTKRAYGMVAYAGMSDSLPNLCYYNNDEYSFSKPYSDHTAELIDKEVKKLIAEQYERAKQILDEHKEGHAQLAQLLIDREVIYAEDVERIFGKRPWVSRTEEILAANAEADSKTDDIMDHNAENEEIIRKKVVEAVLEKAKRGENTQNGPKGDNPAGNEGNTQGNEEHTAQQSQPKQFQELRVTNFDTEPAERIETVNMAKSEASGVNEVTDTMQTTDASTETQIADASIETQMADTGAEAQMADASDANVAPEEPIEPFESTALAEMSEVDTPDVPEPVQAPQKAEPVRASEQPPTNHKTKPQTPPVVEQTLFGW